MRKREEEVEVCGLCVLLQQGEHNTQSAGDAAFLSTSPHPAFLPKKGKGRRQRQIMYAQFELFVLHTKLWKEREIGGAWKREGVHFQKRREVLLYGTRRRQQSARRLPLQ